MKKETGASGEIQDQLSRYKSYSVEEILAAGGTIAFAEKMGKNPENIVENLKKLPQDAFLTEEEAAQALEMLRANK